MSLENCECSVNYSSTVENECDNCLNSINDLEWKWDATAKCPGIHISGQRRNVTFHMMYSSGTAAARGDIPMKYNHHYFWEIRMFTRPYGTDVMIGIATPEFELDQSSSRFASLLGSDSQSWGFSYMGKLQHAGESWQYCKGFELGDVIGAHLDTWNGTLAFYKNGNPLGIAFRGLRSHPNLYPVVCSTAAQISMGLVTATSLPSSLSTLCCKVVARYPQLIGWVMSVPGLKKICQHKWLLQTAANKASIYEDDELVYMYKGVGLFRKVLNISSNLIHKSQCQRMQAEEGARVSGLMDRAVTRSGAWGEFVDETPAASQTVNTANTNSSDIYYNMIPSDDDDDEEFNDPVVDDMFEHKEQPERIRFTNSFSSPLCEMCRVKPAVSVKSCLKKCLNCFFLTNK